MPAVAAIGSALSLNLALRPGTASGLKNISPQHDGTAVTAIRHWPGCLHLPPYERCRLDAVCLIIEHAALNVLTTPPIPADQDITAAHCAVGLN